MKQPKWTDKHRFQQPYADAKASQEPNYLRDRFQAIREQQDKDETERKLKVKALGKKATA